MTLENHFYNWLKVINFGFPTLLYGLAGLIWANHTEQVTVKGNYDTYLLMLVELLRFKFEDTEIFKEIMKPYTPNCIRLNCIDYQYIKFSSSKFSKKQA